MEGTSVKDRILSLEHNSRSTSRATQTSPIRPPLVAKTKEKSFAEAGARLSFQNRVDNNLRRANSENIVPRILPLNNIQAQSRNGHVSSAPALKPRTSSPNHARTLSSHNSGGVSGALQAAAIAAQRQNSPPKAEKASSSRNSEISGKRPEFQRAPASVGSTTGDYLAAAKASVNKSIIPSPPVRNKVPSANLAAKASINLEQTVVRTNSDNRGTVAASTAMIQSRATQAAISIASVPPMSQPPSTLAAQTVSNRPSPVPETLSPSPQPSTLAALSVARKSPLHSPPILPAEREAKFGVILSRAVSPAPSERIEYSHSIKRKPFYQLPDATASEPVLSLNFTDPSHRSYRPSPLGRTPTRPIIPDRDSSSGSSTSLADVGAATAMASRNVSATSLPTLRAIDDIEIIHNIPNNSRRRPTHLKTTMRKERRHEKEKTKHHHVATALTEAERKRYEGVWASNHRHTIFTDPAAEFINNLVVRELWMRSNLSFDLLGHVWDLVDQNRKGKLTKEEFVVGMWLIDQTLSGRKLPNSAISPEVWRSAQRLATFSKHLH